MTLAEVAAKQRNVHAHESHLADDYPCAACVASEVAAAFEADPDFTLGDRVRGRVAWLKARQADPNRNPDWDSLRTHLIAELETVLVPPSPRDNP